MVAVRSAGRLPANPQLPRPARQAIDKHIHFAIIGRASARIRLSLRINISLTIGETYKMIENFSTQFSPLYLPIKYLAIISKHPVHCSVLLKRIHLSLSNIPTYTNTIYRKTAQLLLHGISALLTFPVFVKHSYIRISYSVKKIFF